MYVSFKLIIIGSDLSPVECHLEWLDRWLDWWIVREKCQHLWLLGFPWLFKGWTCDGLMLPSISLPIQLPTIEWTRWVQLYFLTVERTTMVYPINPNNPRDWGINLKIDSWGAGEEGSLNGKSALHIQCNLSMGRVDIPVNLFVFHLLGRTLSRRTVCLILGDRRIEVDTHPLVSPSRETMVLAVESWTEAKDLFVWFLPQSWCRRSDWSKSRDEFESIPSRKPQFMTVKICKIRCLKYCGIGRILPQISIRTTVVPVLGSTVSSGSIKWIGWIETLSRFIDVPSFGEWLG